MAILIRREQLPNPEIGLWDALKPSDAPPPPPHTPSHLSRPPHLLRRFAQHSEYTAQVIGVSDGDTIKVLHDGVPKRIRLWGIDSPELKQPFSARARQFTGDLAFGQAVKVVVRNVDRYGRQVAEVIPYGPETRSI